MNLIREKFVFHTELPPEAASSALERELTRIPVSEEQSIRDGVVAIERSAWIYGAPSIRARVQSGPQGTELRGSFVHPEPLVFLLLTLPIAIAPLFTGTSSYDWGFLGGTAIGGLCVFLKLREGQSMLRAFGLVVGAAFGDDERNEGIDDRGPIER